MSSKDSKMTNFVLAVRFVSPPAIDTDQLWFGVTFDPMEQELSWQPSCPVDVVVSLCQIGAEDVCEDLPHANQTTRTSKVGLAHWSSGFTDETSLAVVFKSPNLIVRHVLQS